MSVLKSPIRLLVVMLAALLVGLGVGGCAASATDRTLDAATFAERVGQSGVTVLDVRTAEEFAQGHLEGALNIDVNAPDFADAVGKLPKDGTFAVYCRSGNRSGTALDVMQDLGFEDAAHLGGGIQAWADAGGKIVR